MQKKYDTTALVEIIDKSGIKRVELARKVGLTKQYFNKKLHGFARFTVTEAYMLCQLLNIPFEEMCNYFA